MGIFAYVLLVLGFACMGGYLIIKGHPVAGGFLILCAGFTNYKKGDIQ